MGPRYLGHPFAAGSKPGLKRFCEIQNVRNRACCWFPLGRIDDRLQNSETFNTSLSFQDSDDGRGQLPACACQSYPRGGAVVLDFTGSHLARGASTTLPKSKAEHPSGTNLRNSSGPLRIALHCVYRGGDEAGRAEQVGARPSVVKAPRYAKTRRCNPTCLIINPQRNPPAWFSEPPSDLYRLIELLFLFLRWRLDLAKQGATRYKCNYQITCH
ncbi:hypothetical protein B0T16DRAFT_181830 [Cercophora newfieldiana]|uniref:Uncharacterized protein n=1 Tax=Cercophora newfieldiana TaxID=92897 RepID=A0AA39Y0E1_9PEZI|nr:hypothetical protein B0T16DRAFT_181830 [Cercophora newfieldiana]